MAFCKKGFGKAKEIINKLTAELEAIIDKILAFTGKLMELSTNPGVKELLLLIPGEPKAQAALMKGIDALTSIKEILEEKDPAKKLSLFMDDLQAFDPSRKHGLLIKLASIITGILHGKKEKESTYDTLVQVKSLT